MADMKQYKCFNCGGTMVFDISSQKLKCEYCDSEYDIEEIENTDNAMAGSEDSQDAKWDDYEKNDLIGMKYYSCNSCGAKVTVSENTVATECVYCGNKITIQDNDNDAVAPDCIIPFKLDKNYAMKAFKNFYKGKLLLPKSFNSEHQIDKITGLYVPFWLFDCDVYAKVRFEGKDISTWTSRDTEYTKTAYYDVKREGSLSFSSIPVDASTSMDNKYMDSLEPYDFNELKDYNAAFMAGYLADNYDEDSKVCSVRANKRIKESIISEFSKTATYDEINVKSYAIDVKNSKVRYVFIPVWILNTRYKDKIYTFAINAQTGKLVGELPSSIPKLIGVSLVSAVIVYIIIQIILYLT